MKNILSILLVSVILFSCLSVNAQETFSENFLGKECLPYKGVKLTLKQNASYLSYSFYGDLSDFSGDKRSSVVIYPSDEYNFVTSADSLKDKIFLVKDIVDKTGAPILEISYSTKPIFMLEDTLTKQIIYYKYEGQYPSSNFPFLTSKIEINKEAVCAKITRSVDEMTDEIKLNTPYGSDFSIYKYITSESTEYYLSLNTTGSTVVVDGTGVIILFTDGSKMTKPDEIGVKAGSNGFNYSAFISLTQEDLDVLSTKQIKKFRLYIFDQKVEPFEGEEFTNFVKCMMEIN